MKAIVHRVYKHCAERHLVQWVLMKKNPKPNHPAPKPSKDPVALAEYLASQAEVLAAQLKVLALPKEGDDMNTESQRLKDALDAAGVSLAAGVAAIPAIQAKIDSGNSGIPVAEVTALADQASAFKVSFGSFVDSVVALEGTSTDTATDTTPQP